MKIVISLCSLFLLSHVLLSQSSCPPPSSTTWAESNNIRAAINNSGNLFLDGEQAGFFAPQDAQIPVATIFASGSNNRN